MNNGTHYSLINSNTLERNGRQNEKCIKIRTPNELWYFQYSGHWEFNLKKRASKAVVHNLNQGTDHFCKLFPPLTTI